MTSAKAGDTVRVFHFICVKLETEENFLLTKQYFVGHYIFFFSALTTLKHISLLN